MEAIDSIYLPTREKWREWLETNHDTESVVWLIYYKKHTGKPSVPYNDAVEEALCFGWIDSLVKKIDRDRYMQKFTPRKLKSTWSAANVRRVEKLIRQDKMTAKGLELYHYAKKNNMLPDPSLKQKPKVPDAPSWFVEALDKNPAASNHFYKLAPSHQRNYLGWIMDAKQAETRLRRLGEAIDMLSKGEKLGMK
ncbi:MAG: hypothetical protein AMS23_03630 [Bacteroides sp. SM1_62]|nr:MAG: hypothetical protein AMS26_14845 [Bacteroides sp. SM23_62]KPL26026.1 MAG: hypothetical protein AMS23_03630 [Bacteroides sp. SM1_62]